MYESKYIKYITKNSARFAENDEIKSVAKPTTEKAAGVPILYENERLYVDNEDNHSIIIGPTGCKKSRVIGFSTVASIIENGESGIINDPKGEIYKQTYKRANEVGAKTYVINLREPIHSDAWNPLMQIYSLYSSGYKDEAQNCIDEFATALVKQVHSDNDAYWENTVKAFIVALLFVYMISCPRAEYFNLRNIIPLCYEENKKSILAILKCMDENSGISVSLRSIVSLESERTRSCLYGVLQSAISVLAKNEGVLNILCGKNSFDFADFGKEQCLLYIIYPDEKKNMDFIVNMIATQSYQMLLQECSSSPNDRLAVRVNYVLDEFSNLVPIECFDNRISESRSKNIRYFLFVQSFQQLKQKYEYIADTIMSNCCNWICFSSKELNFLDTIAKLCGKEVDYNGNEHDLISAFDMQHLQKKKESVEVLVIKQGQYPFITELPDFEYTPTYKLYADSTRDFSDKLLTYKALWVISPKTWIKKISDGDFYFPSEA